MVYVADRDNNALKIYSKATGKKVADVTKTPAGDLMGPYGVAVDCAKDGLVYVSENKRHRVLVLKKDGTYVAAIGEAKESACTHH